MFGGLVEYLNFVGRRAPETVVRTHKAYMTCADGVRWGKLSYLRDCYLFIVEKQCYIAQKTVRSSKKIVQTSVVTKEKTWRLHNFLIDKPYKSRIFVQR